MRRLNWIGGIIRFVSDTCAHICYFIVKSHGVVDLLARYRIAVFPTKFRSVFAPNSKFIYEMFVQNWTDQFLRLWFDSYGKDQFVRGTKMPQFLSKEQIKWTQRVREQTKRMLILKCRYIDGCPKMKLILCAHTPEILRQRTRSSVFMPSLFLWSSILLDALSFQFRCFCFFSMLLSFDNWVRSNSLQRKDATLCFNQVFILNFWNGVKNVLFREHCTKSRQRIIATSEKENVHKKHAMNAW